MRALLPVLAILCAPGCGQWLFDSQGDLGASPDAAAGPSDGRSDAGPSVMGDAGVDGAASRLDEARLAARIHHHNVASVVELGYFEWGYYLVMPYVEGCALGELLARNPDHRPPSLLVPILIEALDGLHAAHVTPGPDGAPAGVVHRDVSPANILVGVDGAARITDFGVAKARTRITSSAQGTIKGTLCYAAPEVYRGGPIDARADVFAAGAVL